MDRDGGFYLLKILFKNPRTFFFLSPLTLRLFMLPLRVGPDEVSSGESGQLVVGDDDRESGLMLFLSIKLLWNVCDLRL